MRQSENKERQLVLRDLEGQLRKVPFQDRGVPALNTETQAA